MFKFIKTKKITEGDIDKIGEGNEKKFLALFHKWYVDSRGWDEVIINAKDIDEATDKAAGLAYKKQGSCLHVTFKVIDLSKYK